MHVYKKIHTFEIQYNKKIYCKICKRNTIQYNKKIYSQIFETNTV